jgi:hypothetical protein
LIAAKWNNSESHRWRVALHADPACARLASLHENGSAAAALPPAPNYLRNRLQLYLTGIIKC